MGLILLTPLLHWLLLPHMSPHLHLGLQKVKNQEDHTALIVSVQVTLLKSVTSYMAIPLVSSSKNEVFLLSKPLRLLPIVSLVNLQKDLSLMQLVQALVASFNTLTVRSVTNS